MNSSQLESLLLTEPTIFSFSGEHNDPQKIEEAQTLLVTLDNQSRHAMLQILLDKEHILEPIPKLEEMPSSSDEEEIISPEETIPLVLSKWDMLIQYIFGDDQTDPCSPNWMLKIFRDQNGTLYDFNGWYIDQESGGGIWFPIHPLDQPVKIFTNIDQNLTAIDPNHQETLDVYANRRQDVYANRRHLISNDVK